jgi:hypothetical protein
MSLPSPLSMICHARNLLLTLLLLLSSTSTITLPQTLPSPSTARLMAHSRPSTPRPSASLSRLQSPPKSPTYPRN